MDVLKWFFNKDGTPALIDGENKAWELSECCDHFWKGVEAPGKYNLNFFIGLRNKIEHRSLPAIDLAVAGECQSALSNFENLIIKEFGDEHALTASIAIAMQLTHISQQSQIEALKKLQKENYKIVNHVKTSDLIIEFININTIS